ncbi:MAG: ferritin-like domain-containing protein [Firmicutes bacterium]|nr:ferritin-like domain-containing protein [Bacillota bacterium]
MNSLTQSAQRTSRRDFLKKAGLVGATMAIGGIAEPLLAPVQAFAATTPESLQEIFNLALTAEQLATTFYYTGIQVGPKALPQSANPGNLPYLQAALDAENVHATIMQQAGGVSLAGANPVFYFPTGTFSSDLNFLGVLNALETAFIEAYLAAVYQFGLNGRSDLAQLAGEILGVESEHRVLGKQIVTDFTNLLVPNNLYLEQADGTSVAVVAQALVPFLSANQFGGQSTPGYSLPTQSQITAAVGPNAGTNPNT